MANVLIIGNNGREHAIIWKLSQSIKINKIFTINGSYGIKQIKKVENVQLNVNNHKEIVDLCNKNQIEIVIIGPEEPLSNGIVDYLKLNNILAFGPNKDAARLEYDKNWAKEFMFKYNIPTARYQSFNNNEKAKEFINQAPYKALVIKANGLAGGKGVIVTTNKFDACKAVDDILINKKFGNAGNTIIVEELLIGEEISVLAFVDGETVRVMLPTQDHKRLNNNNEGPNTGGMGAYCPCPLLTNNELKLIETNIIKKTINSLKLININYTGILFVGLMLTNNDGPKVLEYNCRFGDPETQVLLPLLENDLYDLIKSCCIGKLNQYELKWKDNNYCVGIVMVTKEYPNKSTNNEIITGIDNINDNNNNTIIFHCGIGFNNNNLITNGGRILIVVTIDNNLLIALKKSLLICNKIKFNGKHYRYDIGLNGIPKSILNNGIMTYKNSGVDINNSNNLINLIKLNCKKTNRIGTIGTIGGFGGIFDLKLAGFNDPLLISGTDGIGTKLLIAKKLNKHNTIGIDLVAMCINDILAHGAEPLFFLDYFACGKLNLNLTNDIINGIINGCKLANCTLIGGETAEMPDMYNDDDYDLGGFAVGAVERNKLIPIKDNINENDIIIGLPSSGLHSNGFSLVRKIMDINNLSYNDIAPFSLNGSTYGEEFLIPTKIYTEAVRKLYQIGGKIKAFAHITGGGLLENIPRVLPKHLGVELDSNNWIIPEVFPWLAVMGNINQQEMLRTFNCGIGAILIINNNNNNKDEILNELNNFNGKLIGYVKQINNNNNNKENVIVKNFTKNMEKQMKNYLKNLFINELTPKKRVGVLISGSGTNLQALINATNDPLQEIGAEIVIVISNKDNVEGLKRAKNANIPTKFIDHRNYNTRADFDNEINNILINYNVDIVCLAGFMRLLTNNIVNYWKGRMLNIHPSLLPSFKGINAQKQALDAGVRITGCTVHFVDNEMDSGLIITQEYVNIDYNETELTLIEKIKTKAEHIAYPKALKLLATGKVRLGDDNKLHWSL